MPGENAQQEVELKLDLPAESVKRVLRHPSVERLAEGPVDVRRLRSVYFDTVDRALRQAGLSLRIREIGAQRIQTVKAGERAHGGLFQRWEDEVELDSDTPETQAVSDATLRGTLQRALSGRTLRPLFETDMQRSQRNLRDGSDAWSLDLDVGEVRAGDRSERLCEVEFERVAGRAARLYEAALALLDDVELTVGLVSKAARGYALAEGKRARQPVPEALERMREALAAAPPARREPLEQELLALEEECAAARSDADLQRLHRSRRFARSALELGRIAAGG